MKTDALITLLSTGAGPAPRAAVWPRLGAASLLGWLLALAVVAVFSKVPPPSHWLAEKALWLKLAYLLAWGSASLFLLSRLSRPAARTQWPSRWAAAVPLLMLGFASVWWLSLPAPERLPQLMGHSWSACPFAVFGLGLPALGLQLLALHSLAPTRLRLAGAVAGLVAGSAAAVAYAVACTESSPAFLAVWYSAGVLATSALGAWLGPKTLRW